MAKTTSRKSLDTVKGVGPKRAKKLEKIGISTVTELAKTSPKKLAKKADVTPTVAKKLVSNAKTAKKTTKKATTKKAKTTTKKKAKKRAAKTTKKAAKTTKKSKKTARQAEEKAAKAAASAMKDIIARARDHFRKAPEQHQFFVVDGRTIRDLRELAEALEDMADHVFSHHVNDERHDFANWVHDVLQERALAEQLRNVKKHPDSHQRVIYRHIVRRAW